MKDLRIGDWVQVKAFTEMEYDGDVRKPARRECSPVAGQIVGQCTRLMGTYCKSSGYGGGFEYEPDPPYLAISGTVALWLVRLGMRCLPIEVADDDLEKTSKPKGGLPTVAKKPREVVPT